MKSALYCIVHKILAILHSNATFTFLLVGLRYRRNTIVLYSLYVTITTGCAKKKKDILNIHIKSEGIKIFLQKIGYIEFTIFIVKCQKFTYIAQFITMFIIYIKERKTVVTHTHNTEIS